MKKLKNSRILTQQARLISMDNRKAILMSMKEVELHGHLKELFEKMEPDYLVEITHGPEELGKDIVIVKKDKIGIDVIAVIVKVGNIRAKTLGRVDEVKSQAGKVYSKSLSKGLINNIESQIGQALRNPAEMKTIFQTIPVDKVFIVIAGEISSQARKRLEREIEGRVEIKDVFWLIDRFTNYYPRVFFEGLVIDFIQDKILNLESRHWLSKKGLNLSDYFVEPLVATIDIPIKYDDKDYDASLNLKFAFCRRACLCPDEPYSLAHRRTKYNRCF